MNKKTPIHLMIASLAEIDPYIRISPNGSRVEVSVKAICEIYDNPPPMIIKKIEHKSFFE